MFLTKFGSFKNALLESGIVDEDFYKSDKDKVFDSIKIIKDFYILKNRPPKVDEYEELARKSKLLHRKALENLISKKFTKICIDVIGVANQYKRSKEELINNLRMLKKTLGRTPMANELVEYGLAEKKQYYRTFKMNYMDLIESLGWELSTPRKYYKTREQLLVDYHNLSLKLGRVPLYSDIKIAKDMASAPTYKKYFNGLKEIWDELNFEITSDNLLLLEENGNLYLDKNGNMCYSEKELIISNILIDTGIKFIKEYPYRKLVPELDKKYRADWYLQDYGVLIEYFGLFLESSLENEDFIGRYSRNVIKKLELCRENNIEIIDLYSKDFENIQEILIEKLRKYNNLQ